MCTVTQKVHQHSLSRRRLLLGAGAVGAAAPGREARQPIERRLRHPHLHLHQVANLETEWGRLVRGTEFDWVTFHVFRKSVATMIDASVDAKAAAAQLGHSNEAITQQYYIHKSKVAPDVRQYLQAVSPARAD